MNHIDNDSTGRTIGEVKVKEKSKKINGEYYRVPNIARAYDTEYYLTDSEMAVLVTIGHSAWAWNPDITKTNVEFLFSELQLDTKNQSRSKKEIIENIMSLEQKGYIKVDFDGDEIKNNTLLIIHNVNEDMMIKKVTKDGTTFTGFTPVTNKILKLAKQGKSSKLGQRLKVLTHVVWRSEIDYSISFEEWANVLDLTAKQTKTVIKALEKEDIIEILHGEYRKNDDGTLYLAEDGRPRQERNTYFLQNEMPDVSEEGYKPNAVKKHRRMMKITEQIEQIEFEGEIRIREFPRLLMFGSKLSEDDIKLFLTTDSPTLIEISRIRFWKIMNSKKGDGGLKMLQDKENKVLESFKKVDCEDKIKRSVIDDINIDEIGMTQEQIEARRAILGDDDHEDNFADYDINSDEEVEALNRRINDDEEEENHSFYSSDDDDLFDYWKEQKLDN